MIIAQEPQLPSAGDKTNFQFAYPVLEELRHTPAKMKVFFPLDNREVTAAEINCSMQYDRYGKPTAEFSFTCKRHQMEMAHTAVVSYLAKDGVLVYQLQIRPSGRLRRNGHRSITSTYPDAKAVAAAICKNYAPGSVGRKVVYTAQQAA